MKKLNVSSEIMRRAWSRLEEAGGDDDTRGKEVSWMILWVCRLFLFILWRGRRCL